jgi:GntR family transcriptional regulator/MocR family aminotransferase
MARTSGIAIDQSSDTPLYQQIFDEIVRRVESGALPPEYQLPPTRDLAREVGAHRNTVVRAYGDLEAAGFVTSTVGRGTFVASLERGATAKAPRSEGKMPWSLLLSASARSEIVSRRPPVPLTTNVIDLYRMQPSDDLLPHEMFRRCVDYALRTRKAEAMRYSPPEGLLRLREAIVHDLARQGVPASPDDIIVTSGSQQGLDLVARALIEPGDSVALDRLVYSGASQAFTLAHAKLVPVPSDSSGIDHVALDRIDKSRLKLLYTMPNHSNPTAVRMTQARRRALVEWSQRNRIPLVEDDYAADLLLDPHAAIAPLRALDGDVLYVGSFSKRLMPGLRIGYLVTPPGLRQTFASLKRALDLGASALMQFALAEFLERGYLRAHLGRTLPIYRRRRDVLERALENHLPKGCEVAHVVAGVTTWIDLPKGVDANRVAQRALVKGVNLAASGMFSSEPSVTQGLRLVFARESEARLVEGAKRVAEAIEDEMKRRSAHDTGVSP